MIDPRRPGGIVGLGLLGATLGGFALRRWPWGRLGLDQFDEGIYCLVAAQVARTGRIDPSLIPYAPPGYPALVALGAWLTGDEPPGNLASALAGAATIPLAGLVARSLFGNAAALVAAWSVCLAGPHIAFARMALTDATFLLAWMLGVAAGVAFVRRPGWSTGLLMGLAVGLAQQVKYNGWLLGGAVLLNSVASLARRDERRPERWARIFGFGLVGAGGAALVVLLWYLFVEGHGGYAGLLRHQRSYLDPPSLWWTNLRAQATQAAALATPWPLVGLGSIGLVLALTRVGAGEGRPFGLRVVLVAATGLLVGGFLTCPVPVGLVLLPSLLRDADPARRLVAVTWLLLGILTPFYHPYARLWLPFEGMHWLLLGGWVGIGTSGSWSPGGGRWIPVGLAPWLGLGAISLVLGFGLGLPILGRPAAEGPTLFDPSDRLEGLARTVADRLPRPAPPLLTLVRPALTYSLLGRVPVAVQGGLDQIRSSGDRSAWVLLDSAVVGSEPSPGVGSSPITLLEDWVVAEEFAVPVTLPTALDLDPRHDAGPWPADAHFWLLRPRTRTAWR